jgi:ATP-dependent DNA ligase
MLTEPYRAAFAGPGGTASAPDSCEGMDAFEMLGVKPGLAPMEAKLAEALPDGPGWRYEPKWDGFRCLVFRDGAEVALQSKSGKPLGRYFPEIVELVRGL